MPPLDFPSSPVNGQLFGAYIYDSSIGAWRAQGSTNNVGTQISQLQTASPITVANQAARDALYPTPSQGQSVFRTDLGYQETYYGLYNSSTNPGGRATAGWYGNQRNMGLVPIVPPTVNVSGGSATANSLGLVSFSAATSISFNNVFSSAYQNYKMVIYINSANANMQIRARLRVAGIDSSATSYIFGGVQGTHTGTVSGYNGNTTSMWVGDVYNTSTGPNASEITFLGPAIANHTLYLQAGAFHTGAAVVGAIAGGKHEVATAYDGITLYLSVAGAISGTVQFFGYNS